jgi:hypothetical protein
VWQRRGSVSAIVKDGVTRFVVETLDQAVDAGAKVVRLAVLKSDDNSISD